MSTTKVNTSDHVQGSPSAPVLLVEYADYQCPYCGMAYPIIKKLQKHFGDKMVFVFRNYPLQDLHPFAVQAAVAAEAANLQGKFWEMHDLIFENQRHLDKESLVGYAEKIGLNIEKFKQAFNDPALIKKIESDIASGNKAEVEGTPAFFVNGNYFTGNWTTKEFQDYIESEL